jgi:hypothetical protein
MTAQGDVEQRRVRARQLRLHFACYAVVVAGLAVLDLNLSEARWFHWPAMAWGALFCTHFLYCKSLAVNDEWVEERTSRLRINSYDLGHIRNIEDSYNKDLPPEELAAGWVDPNPGLTAEKNDAGERYHDGGRGDRGAG